MPAIPPGWPKTGTGYLDLKYVVNYENRWDLLLKAAQGDPWQEVTQSV